MIALTRAEFDRLAPYLNTVRRAPAVAAARAAAPGHREIIAADQWLGRAVRGGATIARRVRAAAPFK
jgi:hypothetical protein